MTGARDSPEFFELLEALNVSFHKIVRDSGGNNATRPLVLSTVAAANTQDRLDRLSATMQKLSDPNLIATFHFYGYWPFSVNVAGHTTFDDETRKDIEQAFSRAYDTFVARGIPVIVGEFGLLGFDKNVNVIEHGEILKFFEYVGYYAREKQMPLVWWDNGQHFNRREMQWRDPLLLSVVVSKTRSSNAKTDSIYLRKGAEVSDVQIPLNLNGNTLERIVLKEKPLDAGTDYAVADGNLTIKAQTLRPFATGEFGTNATLMCEFSAGADWPLNVIYYDQPVMEVAEGTTQAFTIPVEFNGDKVSTMEAVYAAGGNAGPHPWTPFKEYDVAFKPDYEMDEVQLTPQFFKDVKDGETRLKLHFWSGAVVNYLITKEGDRVTGKPE